MGIGALRFLLSLLVIDTHYGFLARGLQIAAVDRFGVERLAFVGTGGIAVSGFFVISGYLIALVLCRKYESGWKGAKAFYVSRALRIYPLYWLAFGAYAVALAAVSASPSFTTGRLLENLSLVPYGVEGMVADQNEFGLSSASDPLLIGPAWTLSYDLLFYLLAPWILPRARTCWWVAALGVVYFATFILWADPRPPIWFQFFYGAGMPYLFMFVCGALAYHYRRRMPFRWALALPSIAGLVWVTYFPLGIPNTYVNSLLAALLFIPLVAMLGQTATTQRTDRVLGDLTYSTYLLHLPLLILLQRMAFPAPTIWGLVFTYALSIALLVAFEYPLDKLRDRLYLRSAQQPLTARQATMHSSTIGVVVIVVLCMTVALSVWNNVFRAGGAVPIVASTCSRAWMCDGGRVTFAGNGEVVFGPDLGPANRIVIDIDLQPTSGTVAAGFESADGRWHVGIASAGDECHVLTSNVPEVGGDPPQWPTRCRPHRFVLSRASDRVTVIVDSLWVLASVPAPPHLHAFARTQDAGRGSVHFDNLFVTRR